VSKSKAFRLPTFLLDGKEGEAVDRLEDYLAHDPGQPGGVAYTGSLFDTWDRGGDRPEVADHFTNSDVVAVGFLSVRVRPRAAIQLLQTDADEINPLLAQIPVDVDLAHTSAELVGAGQPADQLWNKLRHLDHVGPTIAGKLLARKRPRLIPVYDSLVKALVGAPPNFWESLRVALQDDGGALTERLHRIGTDAGVPDLSILRVFDIVAWMEAKGLKGEQRTSVHP
jgi:hypothetical protein